MKKFYTSSFNVIKGAANAIQNEHVFSIATKTPADCAGIKIIPELAPGWDIVGPYKNAEKNGSDMAEAQKIYEKAYWNKILKGTSPDIIPDGAILCCYENSSKFCHRQLVAKWATWADKNVEYGGELDTAKKVFDVLAKDIQTDLNFEEETKMTNEVINNVATDTISAQTDTATVNAVTENVEKEEEETKMTNKIENKAAEIRAAIEVVNAAEIVKAEATKKYVALRDAARAAMVVKKIATCKNQVAGAKVKVLKAEFAVLEINGKIAAAIEAGKKTTALETRLAKANERTLKEQEKLAAYEEKLAALEPAVVEVPAVETVEESAIETPVIEEAETVKESTKIPEAVKESTAEVPTVETPAETIEESIEPETDEVPVVGEPAVETPVTEEAPVVETSVETVEEMSKDELKPIVEENDNAEEPEIPVSFAAPKIVHGSILTGKTVIGTVEEPKVPTVAANTLRDLVAKRTAAVAALATPKAEETVETVEKKGSTEAPKTFVPIPAVKQETVPATPKPFVPVNPFIKNVGVAAPAPVAKKDTEEDDGWVISEPIEFDEEIELELGRNRDGSKKTWGTWVLEQTADEVDVPVEGQLIPRDDGTFDTPIVEAWFVHGATGTKDKKKNFHDSFLNNDVYDDIKLENAYNFGDESCTVHDAIMDEIYG